MAAALDVGANASELSDKDTPIVQIDLGDSPWGQDTICPIKFLLMHLIHIK